MSYTQNPCPSLGAYYGTSPYQVYPQPLLPRVCPPSHHYNPRTGRCEPWLGKPPMGAYGAADIRSSFDCNQVWSDAEEGGRVGQYIASRDALQSSQQCQSNPDSCSAALASVNQQISNANYRGGKAADAIRTALNELGYGPLQLGVMWGGADKAAWTKFTSDNNLPAGPGLVNKAGICKIDEELKGGGALGKAGVGMWWLLALIAGGAATVALVSGKKRGQPATGRAMVPTR